MTGIPAALVDGRKLPRRLQVSGGGPWYLAGPGTFADVGAGDLSLADLKAVEAELSGRVLVALPLTRSVQEYLDLKAPRHGSARRGGPLIGASRRLDRFEQLRDSTPPGLRAVAKHAQVAVLPGLGPAWVDSHRLLTPGEKAVLPWTEPRVELTVVRPSTVRSALREAIGRGGPRRTSLQTCT